MADVRIPAQTALVTQLGAAQLGRAAPLAKPEAVRAAQRAFFEAAMSQQASAPAAPVQTSAAAPGVNKIGQVSAQPNVSERRFARPGSVLDIKV